MKVLSWALLLAVSGFASAQAAGFDCTQAHSITEKLICSDTELSDLDTQLSNAYAGAQVGLSTGESADLKRQQFQWLRKVRDRCGDALCLKAAYQLRISEVNPFSDSKVTCAEMRRWPRQVFNHQIDLGTGAGSPIEVDYGCPESLSERGFMKKLLALAEEIRSQDGPQECTGSIVHAERRYYQFGLTEAGISPKTMSAWSWDKGAADWKTFLQQDATAVYFRQWSEQSHFNQAVYVAFVREFDQAAAQLVSLYVARYGFSVSEAQAASKMALSTIVQWAAGSAPAEAWHAESTLLDLLRSGPVSPSRVREAMTGLGAAEMKQALRVALIHDQPVGVVEALEGGLQSRDGPTEGKVSEPLLSLALGHLPNLEYLLRKQYPVDTANVFGKTALFYAIGMSNYAAVEMLLQQKADVQHTYKSASELRDNDFGCSYPDLQHTRRSTLMHAAQNSDVRMLKILLDAGASRDARDDMGYNAYDYAVMGKNRENVRYLASLGLEAAAPQYSSEPNPAVREQILLSTLKIDGYVGKLLVASARPNLLVASVTPWDSLDGGPTTGLYLISIASPDHPKIVGVFPGANALDFALSPDGKRIYFIELSSRTAPQGKKFGLSVVDSSDPAQPSLIAQVEGDFMKMHLSPDGKTLYLQERSLQPAFSRGLLVYDVRSNIPISRCSDPFGMNNQRQVFAYGFTSFPDEPLLAVYDIGREVLLFDVRNPCAPKQLLRASYDSSSDFTFGGAKRTLVTAGIYRYRLTDALELQASFQGNQMGTFHVNPSTEVTVAVMKNDVAVIRTKPSGTYVLTDRFRNLPENVGGVVSTDDGYVYIGWRGGVGVGAVPLR